MEVSFILPTELADIKLHQVLEYEKINKEELPDIDLVVQMVSIFCEITTKDARLVPYEKLIYCAEKITQALAQKPSFHQTFELEGIEYGFIPNLNDITTGEFIDIEEYQSNHDDLWKVLSVLYRPIKYRNGDNYLIQEYDGNLVGAFKTISADIAYGALLFFWTLGNDLLNYTLKYLESEKVQKNIHSVQTTSGKSGNGFHSFIALLKEMSSELNQSQEHGFILAYNGLPTRWMSRKSKRKNTKN